MRFIAALLSWLALAIGLAAPNAPASAGPRVALVIGNSDYQIGPLSNPVNDATAFAASLNALGFDKVMLKINLDVAGFRSSLWEFARASANADIAIVYFAGHGTELSGRNYLLPVDARLERASDLEIEAMRLDTILSQLERVKKFRLVILDSCRNNAFPLAGGQRTLSRGLARIEPEDNTLVAYAAKEGTTAEDGTGDRHSPFTKALLQHLHTPGLDVRILLGRVRDSVLAATNRAQQPHVYGSLGGEQIELAPGGQASGLVGSVPSAALAPPPPYTPPPSYSPPPPPPAPAPKVISPATADITGPYLVSGTNPTGTNYRGTVVVTHLNRNKYRLNWTISTGQTLSGEGTRSGDVLTIHWGQQYPVIYKIGADGVLRGLWSNGAGTENLVRSQ